MGEVVAWVDGGAHVAAVWAEEAEVTFAHFGGWPVAAEGGDRDGHGQVVANSAQQIGVDHDFSEMSDKAKLLGGFALSSRPRSRRGRFPFASGVVRGRG